MVDELVGAAAAGAGVEELELSLLPLLPLLLLSDLDVDELVGVVVAAGVDELDVESPLLLLPPFAVPLSDLDDELDDFEPRLSFL